ncbi:MAG TPA: hypothetical protein VGG85_00075 [Terracidiphilus sp.]|jgi:hypothetical protein
MNYSKLVTTAILIAASAVLVAQSSSLYSSSDSDAIPGGGGGVIVAAPLVRPGPATHPFSRVGFGVGVSPLGVQLSMTTNLNPHFNVRTTGNLFNYSTNFTTEGINADAKLDMKSVGTALDIYPFHKGFRISPGVLFYNTNQLTATASVPGGTSFTLNNQNYYSANANSTTGATPINGNALLSLHKTNPAFTVTTGWGNTLPRNSHWSFPFELGVALTGAPSLNVNLGGWACYDRAQTLCTNINSKTDPIALEIQSNLHTQVAKWTSDIEPLKTYPIASFGVAYSFGVRSR